MKVYTSVIIDSPIDRVWAAVREFDQVASWNPGVDESFMESGANTQVGSIRHLKIADGSLYRETLLAHSDLEHFYSYDIIESPLPCHHYVSTHQFIEITDGNKTLGIWQGEFECDPDDAADLDHIVGTLIYRDAQHGLNQYLKNQSA